MPRCKYIMIDEHTPVLFPEHLTHVDMASKLLDLGEVTSAGFVQVYNIEDGFPKIEVYGGSESLKLNSNPKDSRWIMKMFE